jgi:hypothetical protein
MGMLEEEKRIVSPHLWGASPDDLDSEKDKFLIIERLLEHGGDEQIGYLLGRYDPSDITMVVRESSYLSARTVNYWCIYFGIPREETRCQSRQSLHRWPPF